MNSSLVLFILGYLSYASGLTTCNDHRTCGKCIGHPLEKCVWCTQEIEIENRCQPENFHLINSTWCKEKFILNPNKTLDYVKNKNFSSTVQFRPQVLKIKARPGVPVNFTLSYKPADDFPIDVYFVMDYSFTMKGHKAELEKQALIIYDGLKKFTKNVRLGVGSFVEKPGLPYADIMNDHKTYAFKNHLSLTDDMTAFEDVIKKSEFGSNYDDAEAGLDALMQAMTCEKELNWRNDTRRIIVLATDSTYHSAGDGKMLGAIKPNDMQCHLDGNEYNREIALTHDYPSVSLINKIAGNGNFKIIFAALHKVKDVYEPLAKQILGAKYAELKAKSNIVDIIKTAYEESIQHVEVNHNASSSLFQLKIDQDCESNPTINCESSPKKPVVSIPVSIKSTRCPNPGATEHIITINPLGLNEKLKIVFEVDCQCECEKNASSVESKFCNSVGTFQCGACKCDENRGGDKCQYNCSNEEATDFSKCIQEQNFTKVCNNHGICSCGECHCNPNYSGKFCQYDDTSCPTKNGKLCADKGVCRYAKCQCKIGWIGAGCECPDHDRQCIGPFSLKVCSGRGKCECGECICNKIKNKNEKYLGTFCDSCDECAIERCEEFKEYAHCNHNLEKDICDKKFNLTTEIEVIVANKSDLVNTTNWKMGTQCRTELDDGNFIVFKYKAIPGTHKMLLMIQKEVELPDKAKIWAAIGSAIAGILLIGLLTAIIWKILVNMYDKREYDRFCKEANSQGYHTTNPLYQNPTQNFVNPGFNQNAL